MTKKIVITGAPSTGKSTLIKELSKRKFYTVDEVASYLIERHQRTGQGVHPTENMYEFQKLVAAQQYTWEKEIPSTVDIAIIDRGMNDGFAYCKHNSIFPPAELIQHTKQPRYDHVFITLPFGNFEQNGIRYETPQEQHMIQKLIVQVYQDAGYQPTLLGPMSIEARLDIILDTIHPQRRVVER